MIGLKHIYNNNSIVDVRNGYEITLKQKKIWQIELDLLKELLRVCQKHDVQLFLYAGSLLGAVRHKGFIPWDDDIDVAMDRDNYNKLLSVADEFSSPYFLQYALSDKKYFIGYARLRNSETTAIITNEESIDYNNGIYIDIFVLDEYVENQKMLKKQLKTRDNLQKIINIYYRDYSKIVFKSNSKKFLHKCFQGVLKRITHYEFWISQYNKCITKYVHKTSRVTMMTHNINLLKNYWCKKEDFEHVIYVPFEDILAPIPQDYNTVLKRIYGDYMKFPPVEERGKWHEGIIHFEPDIPYKDYLRGLECE